MMHLPQLQLRCEAALALLSHTCMEGQATVHLPACPLISAAAKQVLACTTLTHIQQHACLHAPSAHAGKGEQLLQPHTRVSLAPPCPPAERSGVQSEAAAGCH